MPVIGNKLYCPQCNLEQRQINFVRCKRCGHDLGAPNVNEVATDDEKSALQKRYNNARNYIQTSGNGDGLNAFERHFDEHVQAVITIDFKVLQMWIKDEAYKVYYRLVEEGKIDIKSPYHDKMRNVVDAFLFSSYGKDITFAALSLNNEGVKSYGDCAVTLEESLIKAWASVLEENSYNFVIKHGINPSALNIPKGYRSVWENKRELAVAKLYLDIKKSGKDQDFRKLVLSSDGKKKDDKFLEVHIYNEVSVYAIKNIFIPGQYTKIEIFGLKKSLEKYPGKVIVV